MDMVESSFDGAPVAYEVSGAGPVAVALIHGLSGDHSDFAAQIDFFSATHQVIAIDLPRGSNPDVDRTGWTMEAHGADVASVITALDLDNVVLVGHSLGGNVTVEAARRMPGRVRGIVWLSSFRSLDQESDPSALEAWLAPFDDNFPAAMEDLTRRNFGPKADARVIAAAVARAKAVHQANTMGLLRSKFGHLPTLVAALDTIDVPIFAINPDFKPIDAESFARHGVDLRIIEGVGHFLMLEDPAAVNDELERILASLS